jgi:predicted metal-binding membrane protein
MERNQKVVLIFIISITAIAWILSKDQPDTMKAMMLYDPVEISLFGITWTVGMAAMMFPSITPVILFYDREIRSRHDRSGNTNTRPHYSLIDGAGDGCERNTRTLPLPILYGSLNIIFVGSYLAIWTIIGITLLLAWSVPVNSFMAHFETRQQFQMVFGIILITCGVYQFSLLKRKCIGYCESPKNFLMRRWSNGISGAINMGVHPGLSCVGCCLPYCLLMVALGWMNLLWMALFASIIFGEKIWFHGIWIARTAGVGLAIIGIMTILDLITIPSDMIM